MRVSLVAVGRLRKGPELALIDDYLSRFDKAGRRHGLGPARVIEVEDRKGGGMAAEAARRLQGWADRGVPDLAILIGGADGLAPELRERADFSLSFGKMVWPHMLVRVMLAEQLYRAASILDGSPYHRV